MIAVDNNDIVRHCHCISTDNTVEVDADEVGSNDNIHKLQKAFDVSVHSAALLSERLGLGFLSSPLKIVV